VDGGTAGLYKPQHRAGRGGGAAVNAVMSLAIPKINRVNLNDLAACVSHIATLSKLSVPVSTADLQQQWRKGVDTGSTLVHACSLQLSC
jgi:hypothetical protein